MEILNSIHVAINTEIETIETEIELKHGNQSLHWMAHEAQLT